MTRYTHNPALLSHADGFALANGATTDAAAGTILGAVTSTGGTITFQSGTWESIGNAGAARLDLTLTGSPTIALLEMLVDIVATPTVADNRIAEILTSVGFACRLNHMTDGRLRLYNAANSTVYTTTAAYTTGARVRILLGAQTGTGTGDGKHRFAAYSGSAGTATTPDETMFSSDAANASTGTMTGIRHSRITSTASSTATIRLVNTQVEDSSLSPIGPLVAGFVPVPFTGAAAITRRRP